jgi:hypothetical protein
MCDIIGVSSEPHGQEIWGNKFFIQELSEFLYTHNRRLVIKVKKKWQFGPPRINPGPSRVKHEYRELLKNLARH